MGALATSTGLVGMASAAPQRRLYVGAYAPAGEGIYGFALDAAKGSLRPLGVTANPNSPSWLLADAATRRIYAAEEGGNHIASYQQQTDGSLAPLQRLPSGGRGPVHLSLGAGRLWTAHYGDARLAAFPLKADGSLGAAESWPSCSGKECQLGPARPERAPAGSQAQRGQAAPHAHMMQPSPDGRWLLATDLGLDLLQAWPLKDGIWPPTAARSLRLSPGSGPRHFVFHPQQSDLVYVLQELSSTLSTVRLQTSGPTLLDERLVLPAGYVGTSYASDLLLAPGGRHLYAFNRLHNSIAVLDLADPTKPQLLDNHWTHGDYPRSACRVDRHLYVCNQRSDQLSHFDLSDPARPRFSGLQIAVPSPASACVL